MAQDFTGQQFLPDARPQALITITVAGTNYTFSRRGALEEIIGERSIDVILSDCLDTDYLSHLHLSSPGPQLEEQKRVIEKINSVMGQEHSIIVRRVERQGDTITEVEEAISAPEQERGMDLVTRVQNGGETPIYRLHLHLSPIIGRFARQLAFEERVESIKQDLIQKIEVLDFSGLFRGNRKAQAERTRDLGKSSALQEGPFSS